LTNPEKCAKRAAHQPCEKAVTREQKYPCADCRSTVPLFYCAKCKAEFERRCQLERDKENARRRK